MQCCTKKAFYGLFQPPIRSIGRIFANKNLGVMEKLQTLAILFWVRGVRAFVALRMLVSRG